MAKYSTELKMKIVDAYQKGEGGCGTLAQKYGVSNESVVRRWVNAYKSQGYEGIKTTLKNKTYSFEFKYHVVNLYLTGETSYQILANEMKINHPSVIMGWVKKFKEEGLDGLQSKKKGPLPSWQKKIPKSTNLPTKNRMKSKSSKKKTTG